MSDSISIIEASSVLDVSMSKKDSRYDSIMSQITDCTESLLDENFRGNKFDIISSVEYLLVKLRLDIEFEQLSVKRLLSSQETPPALRGKFLKRDQYLAQFSLKLSLIRDDIANLQKVVYTQSTRNLK